MFGSHPRKKDDDGPHRGDAAEILWILTHLIRRYCDTVTFDFMTLIGEEGLMKIGGEKKKANGNPLIEHP